MNIFYHYLISGKNMTKFMRDRVYLTYALMQNGFEINMCSDHVDNEKGSHPSGMQVCLWWVVY